MERNQRQEPRPLTNDERKAAEAAFAGRPFNPQWSRSARAVYEGILQAKGKHALYVAASEPSADVRYEPTAHAAERESIPLPHGADVSPEDPERVTDLLSREEAIAAGFLIDVSSTAKSVGLDFPVGITRLLWESSITGSSDIAPYERESRVRDMLLAVRLRLASLDTLSPWIEVPVLLTQEGDLPQLFAIYALFHKDPVGTNCLTLLHPSEISSTRLSAQ
ncbi:MAG: hypothetical protein D6704_04355 [Nitrospirae bacterium]|nr:MAG: hypothetical protein D6704_04355 [Nitrospirota bacterium]